MRRLHSLRPLTSRKRDGSTPSLAISADEAILSLVPQRNGNVYVHECSAVPLSLCRALETNHEHFSTLRVFQLHTQGPVFYADSKCSGHIRTVNYFVGDNQRQAVAEGRSDYVPINLSTVPSLFRKGHVSLDVALLSVSPPDMHGFCSLGTSAAVAVSAAQTASKILAVINQKMPRTHGDSVVHLSQLDCVCEVDEELPESGTKEKGKEACEKELAIAMNVASLINDGDCLQLGIGGIPNAVLPLLQSRVSLGIHTEMFSDGLVDLYWSGAISNTLKTVRPGRIVTGFVSGTRKTFDFVNDNPLIDFKDIAWLNDPSIIAKNDNVVAVNSCVEIDISGQIVSDSIGGRIISGVGGQSDFVKGAAMSTGGR